MRWISGFGFVNEIFFELTVLTVQTKRSSFDLEMLRMGTVKLALVVHRPLVMLRVPGGITPVRAMHLCISELAYAWFRHEMSNSSPAHQPQEESKLAPFPQFPGDERRDIRVNPKQLIQTTNGHCMTLHNNPNVLGDGYPVRRVQEEEGKECEARTNGNNDILIGGITHCPANMILVIYVVSSASYDSQNEQYDHGKRLSPPNTPPNEFRWLAIIIIPNPTESRQPRLQTHSGSIFLQRRGIQVRQLLLVGVYGLPTITVVGAGAESPSYRYGV